MRRYYWKVPGGPVGVCSGEATNFVYVEWCQSGEVHGWPISEKKLKQKITAASK